MTKENKYKPEFDADNHIEDLDSIDGISEKETTSPIGWRMFQVSIVASVLALVISII
jgi:hypothetical protein